MFAIVYKSDGVPVCCQVAGVEPDPVVVWPSEDAAKAFIESRGGSSDFQPLAVNDDSMDAMAKALGSTVDKLMFEQYPG
jgi:hypothetical protein